MKSNQIEDSYNIAKMKYRELEIDTDAILEDLSNISLSIHCWQGDDVGGFEYLDSHWSIQKYSNVIGQFVIN